MTFAPAVAPGFVRRNRAIVALGIGLIVVLVLLGVLTAGGKAGLLDPDAYDPSGAHAVSALLQERGVKVIRTTDVPTTSALTDDHTTVFVPLPMLLSDEEIQQLTDLPGELVVAQADPQALSSLDHSLDSTQPIDVKTRDPRCGWPVATNAGRAEVGGFVYKGASGGCYGGSLLPLPSRHLTLIGDATALRNDHLVHEGNAALSFGILSQQPVLVWLMPDPMRSVIGTRPVNNPDDLLPSWVKAAIVQLVLALMVLALWRARRLGRVVPEPLPVIVRAAETIEGRGRLYRAARAQQTAAEELRAGARQRLGPRVGAGRNPVPDTLVTAVAHQSGRESSEVADLLYGPQPADDAALVRLADDLDALTREVTGS